MKNAFIFLFLFSCSMLFGQVQFNPQEYINQEISKEESVVRSLSTIFVVSISKANGQTNGITSSGYYELLKSMQNMQPKNANMLADYILVSENESYFYSSINPSTDTGFANLAEAKKTVLAMINKDKLSKDIDYDKLCELINGSYLVVDICFKYCLMNEYYKYVAGKSILNFTTIEMIKEVEKEMQYNIYITTRDYFAFLLSKRDQIDINKTVLGIFGK